MSANKPASHLHKPLNIAHTHLATEALRMPLGAECCDETLHDSLLTALAAGGKLLVVALSAESLAVFLVESLWPEVLATQSAEEVLFVPRLVQGTQNTLGGRGDL